MIDDEEKTFVDLLESLDAGRLSDDLTQQLTELLAKLRGRAEIARSAKGELTLKLKFVATENGRLQIDADISVKQPKPPKSSDVRWITSDGSLAGADPRQAKLPLKTPAANDAPLKTPGRN